MNKHQVQVCVLTGRGMSAIGSVAVRGDGAREILADIYRTKQPAAWSASDMIANSECDTSATEISHPHACAWGYCGQVAYGMIVDGERVVDEVLVGCEADALFVIHCHGNPLLIEQVVKLCQARGAELVDAEAFAFARHVAGSANTIAAEAKLAMQTSATLLGAKILNAQIDGGLLKWAKEVLANMDTLDIADVQQQAKDILEKSAIATRIIEGVRIVLAGPPNSGKSTLLNCLSGQQEVIVSDTAGTTRDWVSIHCKLGPLAAEIIDTAGLDGALAGKDNIEQTAQAMTKELLELCDLIVYVTDVTEGSRQEAVGSICADNPVVLVENKLDLAEEYKNTGTQERKNTGIQECRNVTTSGLKSQASSLKSVCISAKENSGIDKLVEAILAMLGVDELAVDDAIAFTPRQREVLSELKDITHKADAKTQIERLVHGDVRP